MAKNKQANIPPYVLNIYKPKGISSFDVVRYFKRNLPTGYGKIGHFGTLDPFASGVLLIGVAGAAKLNDYIHELLPKTYIATGRFGVKKSTGDLTGEDLESMTAEGLESIKLSLEREGYISDILESFLGKYLQSPPAFSATKHKGKALYKWAREGIEIKKPEVERYIHRIELVEVQFPEIIFKVTVSSGTYIRTLFEDIATKCGGFGHLRELERESIGHHSTSLSLKDKNWPVKESGNFVWEEKGISLDQAICFEKLFLSSDESARYRNGQRILKDEWTSFKEGPFCWVFKSEGKQLLGLGKIENSELKVVFGLPEINN